MSERPPLPAHAAAGARSQGAQHAPVRNGHYGCPERVRLTLPGPGTSDFTLSQVDCVLWNGLAEPDPRWTPLLTAVAEATRE